MLQTASSAKWNIAFEACKQCHQRVQAVGSARFKHDGKKSCLEGLYQQGSAKIRFPKSYTESVETVLINTAGGLTGGDRLDWNLSLGTGSKVVATTQACEKSYRSTSGAAKITTSIVMADDTSLHWLPQETILYEGSRLARSFSVEMGGNAEFLGLECLVLGRDAMGEKISNVAFHDRWRIRQNGKLVFADDLRLDADIQSMAGLAGQKALASLVYVGNHDRETLAGLADKLRAAAGLSRSGFSVLENRITGRILSENSYELRQVLAPVLGVLRDTELPKVWRL
ncbi:MAG: urease accessory protein UreD [Pseudomonadota bacterium]